MPGGSQGIGKALAQLLASKGASIIIVVRGVEKLEATLPDIRVILHHSMPQTQY